MLVVCGPPGVGSTAVGRGAADRLDGRRLRTDTPGRSLLGEPGDTDRATGGACRGPPGRAGGALAGRETAALDGTFCRREYRVRARRVAREAGAEFRLVRVVCDSETVRRRIAERGDDDSDVGYRAHLERRDRFEAIETDHLTVDNSGGLAGLRAQLAEAF